jgi:hypothetical protein
MTPICRRRVKSNANELIGFRDADPVAPNDTPRVGEEPPWRDGLRRSEVTSNPPTRS